MLRCVSWRHSGSVGNELFDKLGSLEGGVPTRDKDGKEVSKKRREKLTKAYEAAVRSGMIPSWRRILKKSGGPIPLPP
jgi:hypothetical protein